MSDSDLLMSHINSKTYIGRTVEYKAIGEEIIIHGMNLLRLKSNVNVINSTFFAYYTNSGKFKSAVARIRKDAVNQSSMAISDIKKIEIPVPPKSTQLAIVSELDKINELIRLKKEQLIEYDNLAQSIFYEMFGDPVENEKGWEVKKLGDITDFKNGLNFGKTEQGFCYKFLGVSDFQNNASVKSDQLDYVNLSDELPQDYFLKEEDIVFVRSNGSKELVGRNILMHINEPTTYSGFCIRCRVNSSDCMPAFLAFLLRMPTMRPLITNSGRGCNISNLNQKILGNLPILYPPLPLQQSFASRIEQIEKLKSEVQNAITDLETLLASRMQYWFE